MGLIPGAPDVRPTVMSWPQPGDALEALERTIDLTRMVAYAGATWDWHRLHYDIDEVRSTGLPAPVVDGQMLGALMAEQVLDTLGPDARLIRMSFRFKSMVFAGETVRVEGTVSACEANDAEAQVLVEQRVLVGDRLAAEGSALARMPLIVQVVTS